MRDKKKYTVILVVILLLHLVITLRQQVLISKVDKVQESTANIERILDNLGLK